MAKSLVAAALLSLLAAPSLAAPVRIDFVGTVASFQGQIFQPAAEPIPITAEEAEAAFGGSLQVGTPFSGFFVYDDAATPTVGDSYYQFTTGSSFAAHAELGGFTGDGDSGTMELFDSPAFANTVFVHGAVSDPLAPAGEIALVQAGLFAYGGAPGSPLEGVTLPGIPWTLDSFPLTSARFHFRQGDLQVNVDGTVTSLVPEPTGLGVVALATLAAVTRRRVTRRLTRRA